MIWNNLFKLAEQRSNLNTEWTPEFGSIFFHLRVKRQNEKSYVPCCLLANSGDGALLPPSIPSALAVLSPSSVHLIKIHLIWIFFANMVWWHETSLCVILITRTPTANVYIWRLWHWTPPLLDLILRVHVILGAAKGWEGVRRYLQW